MFFETLYRVDPRGKSFDPGDLVSLLDTEYYQPHIEFEFRGGKQVFFVREKHGFFDDQQKKMVHHRDTLNPEEGFAKMAEAWTKYGEQTEVWRVAGIRPRLLGQNP